MKNPIKTRTIERWYTTQLLKVARHVGDIVNGVADGPDLGPEGAAPVIDRAMRDYADLLNSWARATAARMIAQVDKQDEEAWMRRSREMAGWLQRELRTTKTGAARELLLGEQVKLIKSIPLDAARRVHTIVQEAQISGVRADTVAAEIMRTNEVSASKARLIARTEVARASSTLTEARARGIGSTGYIWRTSTDGDVRPSHRTMEGKFVSWDQPPTLDKLTGHAGCLPNCRCFPDPVIPDL